MYRRIRLGKGGAQRADCIEQGYVGLNYGLREDLTGKFPPRWRDFNAVFVPQLVENDPSLSKIAAGLGCGSIWTLCYEMSEGDFIFAPDDDGDLAVARITGPYIYAPGTELPHRRPVEWTGQTIARSDMSETMWRSIRGPQSLVSLSGYESELLALLDPNTHRPKIIVESEEVEDPSVFALERHLEDFLVANWTQTPLAAEYKILEGEEGMIGQQYQTDTGPIDILAVSHDNKELLVIELKKGRASDAVVGQIQRYMGFVKQELAEEHQLVRGMIIALEDDLKIKRALSVASNIDFYRYKVSFDLEQVL